MYLTHYDENGNILGFYIQGMHTNIPEPTLEITIEQHAEYFSNGQNYKIIDGVFVHVEPVVISSTKAQKITLLNAAYKTQVAQINMLIINAVVVSKDVTAETANRALLTQAQDEYKINLEAIKNG